MKKNKTTPKLEHNLKLQVKLKKQSYATGLYNVRQRLPAHYKLLSRLTQSTVGEKIYNLLVRTIGRPYSLLFGSILSLLGVVAVSYYAKTYGYRFNLLLIVYLFGLGYILATLVELVAKTIKKLR